MYLDAIFFGMLRRGTQARVMNMYSASVNNLMVWDNMEYDDPGREDDIKCSI